MNQIILCSVTFLFLGSCGIKTQFSDAELKWINVYKEGDTLIFKSDRNRLDTSVIIKKEMYYPSYNPIELHGTYLPQHATVWYKNSRLIHHAQGNEMISMIKKHPTTNTFLYVGYQYSSFLVPNLTNSSFNTKKKGKMYTFNTYHKKANPIQPKILYWHEDVGLIKYVTHENEIWERINLPLIN